MDHTEISLPTLMILISFGLSMLCGAVGDFAVNVAYGKPATQSSTYIGNADFKDTPGYEYAASLAVDGNKNTSFKNNGCSHTNWTSNIASWEVNLLGFYKVSTITIYQRTDANKDWLSGFVTKGKLTNDTFLTIDNPQSLVPGTVTIHLQTSMKFKGIRIELEKNPHAAICLCEVEVLAEINVAENKLATQSSGFNANSFPASFAVDGKTTTNFSENSCSCTKPGEKSAWWKVDLQAIYLIIGIRIYQRTDSNKERLNGFTLFGLNASRTYEPIQTPDPYHTDMIDISISPPRMFKEIMVQLNHSINTEGPIITLCEVQVFAGSMCSKQPPFPRRSLHNDFHSKEGNGSYNFSLQCIEGYSIARPISNLCVGINRRIRTFGRCSDIDECSIQPSACHNNGHCFDSNGNFACECSPGYKGAACENVVRCNNSLLQPEHGTLIYTGGIDGTDTYNTVVTVSCEEGYKLTTATEFRCSKSGVWEGSLGICSVNMCPTPPTTPKNSDLSYIPGIAGNGTYGSSVKVYCHEGYKLQGIGTLTCTSDGTWNDKQFGSCSVITCPIPPIIPKNSYSSYIPGIPGNLTYNSSVKINCLEGYKLNGTGLIRCTAKEMWSDTSFGYCALINCPIPPAIPENSESNYIPGIGGNFTYNSSVKINCREGYQHQGTNNAAIRCTSEGTWSAASFGNCSAKTCPILPKTPANSFSNYISGVAGNSTYNSSVKIICHEGYKLQGPDTLTCIADGTWSETSFGNCSEILRDGTPESSVGGVAGGTTAAIFLVILGVIVALILYRRWTRRPEDMIVDTDLHEISCPSKGKGYKEEVGLEKSICAQRTKNKYPKQAPEYDESKNVYMNSNESSKEYYSFTPQNVTDKHSIRVEDLSSFFLSRKMEPGLYEEEYNKLPNGLTDSHKAALLPENRTKNRYKNIYPYDDTRVILEIWDPSSETDYINASYINGVTTFHGYIAAQGPTKGILNDFWRMIWQTNCSSIVMLTNLIEEGKHKCEKYWPDEGSVEFGDLIIRLVKCERFSDFTIRTLEIRKTNWKAEVEKSEAHTIQHFHFTAWPDRGVPRFSSSLVLFHHKIRAIHTPSNSEGPMVVHCSAGIGRTGTFLALDLLIDQAVELGYINVVSCVENLRKQRVNLVQTLEQYIFLHETLVEALTCTTLALSTSKFQDVYNVLLERDNTTGKRRLNLEFDKLTMYVSDPAEDVYENAKNMENRYKNRYNNILPDKNYCPFLNVYVKGRDSYINAVFLPAYKENDIFIITQTPLEKTLVDFWRMVYQFEVSSIVMLNTLSEMKKEERYWTEDEASLEIVPFRITLENKSSDDISTNYTMMLKYQDETRRVRLSRATYWDEGKPVPKSPSAMLKQIEMIQNWQQETGSKPIIVHCMNGAERSGLFCVIAALLERTKIEHDVAIEQIIKQMRCRRPQVIPNVDQFKFCHDAVLAYLNQFETYSNFTGL